MASEKNALRDKQCYKNQNVKNLPLTTALTMLYFHSNKPNQEPNAAIFVPRFVH